MEETKFKITDGPANNPPEFITSLTYADDVMYGVTNYGRIVEWGHFSYKWYLASFNPSRDNPLPPIE